tara:strand:+ start:632 stop:1135 length:504 start_codon:yes stop_codon:yes gene_type:complete
MIFKEKRHNINLYNILLNLSRNISFYKKIGLPDTFETRIYLMFFHFSILMIVTKKKGSKFDQKLYDLLFHNIENNLRELGFGDVSVNKKMKEFNKILYDILLKIDLEKVGNYNFNINIKLIKKYFSLNDPKMTVQLGYLKEYFVNFFNFCFEQSLNNMLKDLDKFNK